MSDDRVIGIPEHQAASVSAALHNEVVQNMSARITELEAELAADKSRSKRVLDLWDETIARGRAFLAGEDLVIKMREILAGETSNHEDTDISVREVEEELAEREATIEAAPHGEHCTINDYIPEPCDCWKADTSNAALDRVKREAAADALEQAAEELTDEHVEQGWLGVDEYLRDTAKAIRKNGE